jgi:hypothetical protein
MSSFSGFVFICLVTIMSGLAHIVSFEISDNMDFKHGNHLRGFEVGSSIKLEKAILVFNLNLYCD